MGSNYTMHIFNMNVISYTVERQCNVNTFNTHAHIYEDITTHNVYLMGAFKKTLSCFHFWLNAKLCSIKRFPPKFKDELKWKGDLKN